MFFFYLSPLLLRKQVVHANYLVLPAKKEKVLQGMTDGLIEICTCYGMEMNVENIKAMGTSRQPSPV